LELNFNKGNGLVPAVVQDAQTQKVLMLGYMNEEAWQKTQAEKVVTFYSRTKERLWTKGETSGNFLQVVETLVDCDQDTILIRALPTGAVCHTGADTCFQEKNVPDFLTHLGNVIQEAHEHPREGSYTASLFAKGINKVAQKVGEEAVEVVIEAKDSNDELFLGECADLMYHFLVLLRAKGFSLQDVTKVLEERHKK
jgi:phosphoribosyl-ATP pyrophosphohydrolase/phosphoribosyl-AMP cyclohydrolase